jgi:hypothetical protein
MEEESMYAAIRQGKARAGMAEELALRIKEGVIPIVSDVPGFMGYYVVYASGRYPHSYQHVQQC